MRKGRIASWTAVTVTLLGAPSARGEDWPGALEVTVGLGYEQGFGGVGLGIPRLQDTGAAGGAMEIGLGWRLEPHFTMGVYGSGSAHGAGHAVPSGTHAYAATVGLMASYHGRPYAQLDPWIGLGLGWRAYWIEGAQGTDVLAGIDQPRIEAGVDYRVGDRMSVSPVVGLSVTRFASHKAGADGSYRDVADPTRALFVFGGVLARFDVLEGR